MNNLAIAVDAARDAAQRRDSDERLAYGARLDRATAEARERVAKASGAALSLLFVEELSAAAHARHFDALIAAARDLAHTSIRGQEPASIRVAAVWDVIEDEIVSSIVSREMR